MTALDKIINQALSASRKADFSADAWVKTLKRSELLACSAAWISEQIESRHRAETLRIEREASRRTIAAQDAPPALPVEDETFRVVKAASEASSVRIAALARAVTEQVSRHRDSMVIEWSAELLARQISLPDGTQTTWGAATREQHIARAEMFEKFATANIEGAARHRRAAEDLKVAGVPTLNALTEVAAA